MFTQEHRSMVKRTVSYGLEECHDKQLVMIAVSISFVMSMTKSKTLPQLNSCAFDHILMSFYSV
jgi:hypothetical protein